ncbi:NAD(P)/FAD-dependent oxidoreductase [Amycolatopsis sp. FDAARGOS 1241]|uniref:NAD(P)/FAD-dependent oxidoreductase n=1 Tax=Amycolatopsis sp. FDAARGOS 1241 TaxID=2778070 RepID=UPI00194F494A|nr:FAD-dependent oxidoreductase [Amycolatopsis sp. FDAARGOS 1241]QRP48540.1 FAD-dependent oxidoreductase [Amycolatopsis sp. FDAARGOS 1241]
MKPGTVVVGASVAGVRVAQALRSHGHEGRIVLVGQEDELPYDKPPLSKGVLAGSAGLDDVRLLTTEEAADAGIELELGRAATRLDLAGSVVHLAGGTALPYTDLVIATGAGARPAGWEHLDGVHVLRTAADAVALREDLGRGGPLVVIGGGFIGAEVAATARGLGLTDVTVLDATPTLLARSVPAVVGDRVAELHRRNGVQVRLGVKVDSVDRIGGGLRIRLADGSEVDAATVVVGIGAVPNDAWVAGSGLKVDDGIVCDRFGRAAPHVFAVGDVSRWQASRHGSAVRVEHWTNAVEQAAAVAHTLAHPEDPRAHTPVDYVWTDQYDWKVQIAGTPVAGTEGRLFERAGDKFATVFGTADRFAGAVVVNWPKALVGCRRALAAATPAAEVCEHLNRLAPVSEVAL